MAGYAVPGQEAYRLLKNAEIRAAIDAKLNTISLGPDRILAILATQATADMGEFLDVTKGKGKRAKETIAINLGRAKRRGKTSLIKKLTPTRNGLSIELHSSLPALELLGKFHGLWKDQGSEDRENALVNALRDALLGKRPGAEAAGSEDDG